MHRDGTLRSAIRTDWNDGRFVLRGNDWVWDIEDGKRVLGRGSVGQESDSKRRDRVVDVHGVRIVLCRCHGDMRRI